MADDPAVEALLEACASAGAAARRANEAAIRGAAQGEGTRRPAERGRCRALEQARSDGFTSYRYFFDAQRQLADANRVRFKERLDEVTRRVAERLARLK